MNNDPTKLQLNKKQIKVLKTLFLVDFILNLRHVSMETINNKIGMLIIKIKSVCMNILFLKEKKNIFFC